MTCALSEIDRKEGRKEGRGIKRKVTKEKTRQRRNKYKQHPTICTLTNGVVRFEVLVLNAINATKASGCIDVEILTLQ